MNNVHEARRTPFENIQPSKHIKSHHAPSLSLIGKSISNTSLNLFHPSQLDISDKSAKSQFLNRLNKELKNDAIVPLNPLEDKIGPLGFLEENIDPISPLEDNIIHIESDKLATKTYKNYYQVDGTNVTFCKKNVNVSEGFSDKCENMFSDKIERSLLKRRFEIFSDLYYDEEFREIINDPFKMFRSDKIILLNEINPSNTNFLTNNYNISSKFTNNNRLISPTVETTQPTSDIQQNFIDKPRMPFVENYNYLNNDNAIGLFVEGDNIANNIDSGFEEALVLEKSISVNEELKNSSPLLHRFTPIIGEHDPLLSAIKKNAVQINCELLSHNLPTNNNEIDINSQHSIIKPETSNENKQFKITPNTDSNSKDTRVESNNNRKSSLENIKVNPNTNNETSNENKQFERTPNTDSNRKDTRVESNNNRKSSLENIIVNPNTNNDNTTTNRSDSILTNNRSDSTLTTNRSYSIQTTNRSDSILTTNRNDSILKWNDFNFLFAPYQPYKMSPNSANFLSYLGITIREHLDKFPDSKKLNLGPLIREPIDVNFFDPKDLARLNLIAYHWKILESRKKPLKRTKYSTIGSLPMRKESFKKYVEAAPPIGKGS